jgi:hypothetical protein
LERCFFELTWIGNWGHGDAPFRLESTALGRSISSYSAATAVALIPCTPLIRQFGEHASSNLTLTMCVGLPRKGRLSDFPESLERIQAIELGAERRVLGRPPSLSMRWNLSHAAASNRSTGLARFGATLTCDFQGIRHS